MYFTPPDPPIDEHAVVARYAIRWRYALLSFVGMVVLALASAGALERPSHDRKMRRLSMTARISSDPAIVQAAQQQMADLENSFGYRTRHVASWSPFVLGFALMVPFGIVGIRARRNVRWAKRGCCMGCGYDRRATGASSSCPECGTPPPPRKAGGKRWRIRLDRRFGVAALGLLGMAVYFGAVFHAVGWPLLALRDTDEIEDAYKDAPSVIARHMRVIHPDGTLQFSDAHDASGAYREERWDRGALTKATVYPVGDGTEMYVPGHGVKWHPESELPGAGTRFGNHSRTCVSLMAHVAWRGDSELTSDGRHEIYRSHVVAALHDHLARSITIVIVDAATRRPLYEWDGDFDEVLDPNAVPPLRALTITEIEYPDALDPSLFALDEETPGRLRAEVPPYPEWLDRAWVDPVLGPAPAK